MLFTLNSSLSYSSTEVKIATDPWCPYVCEEENDLSGILVEIVELAFAETGYLVEFVSLNWARAITQARKGEVQGIIGGYKSDSPDFVFGEEHLLYAQMCFYTEQDDDWVFESIEHLTPRVMVVVNRYSYGTKLDDYIVTNESSGNKITRIYGKHNMSQRLKLLAKNKVNTLVEEKFVMTRVNNRLAQQAQLREAGCLPAEKIYLAFSPNSNLSPRLSRAFDKGVRALKQKGTFQKIVENYQKN